MTYKWMPAVLAAGVLMAGCTEEQSRAEPVNSASDGEVQQAAQDTHAAENSTATARAPIEEAANVPAAEKKAILAVLQQQIQAFNEKNIDAYMATISKQPESFTHEEEKAYVEKVFQTLDANMTVVNPTIIKYEEKTNTANVFMNAESTSKDKSTGKEVSQETRQIMVFAKEEGGWKQVSLFAME